MPLFGFSEQTFKLDTTQYNSISTSLEAIAANLEAINQNLSTIVTELSKQEKLGMIVGNPAKPK